MEEEKNLYLVKSNNFQAYVIASDPTEAWNKLSAWLEKKDYGFFWERKFASVQIVARMGANPQKIEGWDIKDNDKLFL